MYKSLIFVFRSLWSHTQLSMRMSLLYDEATISEYIPVLESPALFELQFPGHYPRLAECF